MYLFYFSFKSWLVGYRVLRPLLAFPTHWRYCLLSSDTSDYCGEHFWLMSPHFSLLRISLSLFVLQIYLNISRDRLIFIFYACDLKTIFLGINLLLFFMFTNFCAYVFWGFMFSSVLEDSQPLSSQISPLFFLSGTLVLCKLNFPSPLSFYTSPLPSPAPVSFISG